MISKNFQKYPLRVHTHARAPMGALRGSAGGLWLIYFSGEPQEFLWGLGKNLGSQKSLCESHRPCKK